MSWGWWGWREEGSGSSGAAPGQRKAGRCRHRVRAPRRALEVSGTSWDLLPTGTTSGASLEMLGALIRRTGPWRRTGRTPPVVTSMLWAQDTG